MVDKLASISEYNESSTTTSLTALSTYTGYSPYPRSPSDNSLNTISSTATSTRHTYSRNGLPGDRKVATDNALQQRLRAKSLSQKQNYELCKKVRVTMALIGILLLVAAIFMLSFYLPKQYSNPSVPTTSIPEKQYTTLGQNLIINYSIPLQMNFSYNLNDENITRTSRKPRLKAYFGQLLTEAAKKNITRTILNGSVEMTFQELDLDLTVLKLTQQKFSNQCYEVYWITKYHSKLEDCFDVNSSHWFGLGEVFSQKWPIDKSSFGMTPFLTTDFLDEHQLETVLGGVLEPFIVSSTGAGIYIDEKVPLHISMNDGKSGKFCIRADHHKYNVKYKDENSTNVLNYTICIGKDIKEVHQIMYKQFIKKPKGVPDERMFKQPIWSTWVKYKQKINESVILKFAADIKKHNFEASHIEIDDKYSTDYGDYNFDPKKFDDPNHMINIIRSYGFRVTTWVYPFANLKSKAFLAGLDYWMKVGSKGTPGIAKWWNGMGGILDATKAESKKWFLERLREFQRLKIDGFKFDAGEVNYLPLNYNFSVDQPNPNYFTKNYVEMASELTGLVEVRCGYKSQEYPVFVRILDRTSSWPVQNGLRSVLTATLTFGILGYPFVLPDMVGGNAYLSTPSQELYVRWAQLCAFLPAIQFSLSPWQYNNEVLNIVQEALAIRKNMSSVIYEAATQAQITGEPIIRPLWWYWPNDHETFVIETEFMLSDKYLVAPVLHLNIEIHAIYLPVGLWEEQWGERSILNMTVGGFKQYNVTLRDICYFRLLENYHEEYIL